MIRMEIALFFVLVFIAMTYFPAERKSTELHTTFSVLLIVMMIHLVFDAITVKTVNALDLVPELLNSIVHRFFVGTMIFIFFLLFRYISILVEDETGKPRRLELASEIFLIIFEVLNMMLPIHYTITPKGNYSDGLYSISCYICVTVYFALGTTLVAVNWKKIDPKKRRVIALALFLEGITAITQAFHPTWLLSGMGLTLVSVAFYLTLENPDILRAELVEQKMSMLYLKSQINPHFLYNTLDTIRIQAQLNGDKEVSDLLMSLVDFFRMSVKVDRPMVQMDDEMDLLEAYMDLMCYRYPNLICDYDVDPELGNAPVPNFILQPIVENSLLHGLKSKGYRGQVCISAKKVSEQAYEICVKDSGNGFAEGKKEEIDEMLRNYAKKAPKLTGNSIGLLNVQKRIKLLCGREYGLSYTENPEGGVTAHILLPLDMEE